MPSHLTVLAATVASSPESTAFRTPQLDHNGAVEDWNSITYRQFSNDIDSFARHWKHTLQLPRGSVVGLWISGFTYTDIVNIYSVTRAGFIPQLFSLRLPNPDVIAELLRRADAQALIFNEELSDIVRSIALPKHVAVSSVGLVEEDLPDVEPHDLSNTAFIFHTSGSTSGSPKLVPCSYRWLSSAIRKSHQVSQPQSTARQDVTVWMGSVCHIAQSFMLLGNIQHVSCLIQPTKIAFSSEELVDMVQRCQLNRLNQFPAFLANHLRHSRSDKKFLSTLASMDEILYSGMPLPREEEEWALSNGINLVNLFGSTECGAMMRSSGKGSQSAPLLVPLEGTSYRFAPINEPSGNHRTTGQLLEMIICKESDDCPDESLRHDDGDFHPGDLFQEVRPGHYISRGRDDDWIKTETSLRCDTKAVEDNVRATCSGLVDECIVVGTGRPSPALFVETSSSMEQSKLKRETIRRIKPFHQRRYIHERIVSPSLIVILPSKSLPRTSTKGNIRRKAVEEAYHAELDEIYRTISR